MAGRTVRLIPSRMNNWILEIEPLAMSKPKRGSEPRSMIETVWQSEPLK